MSRLLTLRQDYRSHHQRLVFATAIVVCVLVIVGALITYRSMQKTPATANNAVVSETVNLWDAGTVRGEHPGELQSVSLSEASVRLKIILPRFSPPGRYAVAVTRDQTGTGVLAGAMADTIAEGQQQILSVNLDLHRAAAGTYFLATTHEQDQAAYYYPLQIK
jgi:hypothetical protein